MLSTLERYKREFSPNENENELQKVSKFWGEFVSEVKQELDLTFDEVQAMLTRLTRNGCYETIQSTTSSTNHNLRRLGFQFQKHP